MAEAIASAVVSDEDGGRWFEGRNGGRLRIGTKTPGPKRTTTLVRKAMLEALRDKRGGAGAEFFVKLKCGSSEDRRAFATICSRLIPVELQAEVGGELLRVVVNTLIAAPGEVRHLPTTRGAPIEAEGVQHLPAAPDA